MQNHTNDNEFTPPHVPAADPRDGLLPIAALSRPLQVDIRLLPRMRPHDILQLRLGGVEVGRPQSITMDDVSAQSATLWSYEFQNITEGAHRLGYYFTNTQNGVIEYSPDVTLIVDRSAPGAALLAPIILSELNSSAELQGEVPGYAGMEPGDVIQTHCNETEGPRLTVATEHMKDRPIQVAFALPFLEGLPGESVRITYHVIDRAGNRSIEARPVEWRAANMNPGDTEWTPFGVGSDGTHWTPSGTHSIGTEWSPSGL